MLNSVFSEITLLTQRHLAYPVLQRRMLCASVEADGWSWDDVFEDDDRAPAGSRDVEQ